MTHSFGRRAFLGGAATALLAPVHPGRAADCGGVRSLGAAAADARVLFGCSIGVDVLPDRPYVDLMLREARILTTDLAFKLPFINPQRGRFDFGAADQLVAFAQANKLPLRGHTLFWDLANPEWVAKLSVDERRAEFDRILETVVSRYRGQLHSWDLVNEPFWPGFGEPGGFRRGAWYDALGPRYVDRAFERAAVLDPGAKLVLNQDMTERDDAIGLAVRKSLLQLVDDLRAKGRRIDAVGLQGHIDPSLPFEPAAFETFLWQLADRKVAIYITELDVLDTSLPKDIARRDLEVGRQLRRFLDIVLKVPAVEMIVTWQLADSRSWYRSDWYRSVTPSLAKDWLARPLPFDDRLERKSAWYEMVAAFCARKPGGTSRPGHAG